MSRYVKCAIVSPEKNDSAHSESLKFSHEGHFQRSLRSIVVTKMTILLILNYIIQWKLIVQ